jgi:glucokinase
MPSATTLFLTGDIGGTKTNLALIAPETGPRQPLVEATFPSNTYPNLETIVQEFLRQTGLAVEYACFGVAGPVVNGRATITNLPWVMEEKQLAKSLPIRQVVLLNDLAAIANAIPFLTSADLYTINPGQPVANGPLAVVAPGTGLGEAFLLYDGTRYRAYASEGGHTDFAPSTPQQTELLRFLQTQYHHVSWERVCSGLGIPNLYAFLKTTGVAKEPDWLANELATTNDPTRIIMRVALDETKQEPLCRATLDLFIALLGAEAGNMALKVLATGGVFLGGGIPPRLLGLFQESNFMAAFQQKGRFSTMLGQMPVHVILNTKAGLLGAAYYGLAQFSTTKG